MCYERRRAEACVDESSHSLMVLNLVSSTPPCIRQPELRIRVLGACAATSPFPHALDFGLWSRYFVVT
jgi:hypothetical protein